MDRLIIIGAVFISITISNVNKIAGGIASLIVTTGILLYGLSVYAQPGYTMTFFEIEISRSVFFILIGIWYLSDLRQIHAGLREQKLAKKFQEEIAKKLRANTSPTEIVRQLINDTAPNKLVSDVASHIISGQDYPETITYLAKVEGLNTGDTVLVYKQTIDLIYELQAIISQIGRTHQISISQEDLSKYFWPALKVKASKRGTFTAKFKVGDLIFSYDEKLLIHPQDVAEAMAQANSDRKVSVGYLRLNDKDEWVVKRVLVKKEPLQPLLVDWVYLRGNDSQSRPIPKPQATMKSLDTEITPAKDKPTVTVIDASTKAVPQKVDVEIEYKSPPETAFIQEQSRSSNSSKGWRPITVGIIIVVALLGVCVMSLFTFVVIDRLLNTEKQFGISEPPSGSLTVNTIALADESEVSSPKVQASPSPILTSVSSTQTPTVTSLPPTPTVERIEKVNNQTADTIKITQAVIARPTNTSTPIPIPQAYVVSDVNLRAGPGSNYPILGESLQGDILVVTGRNISV